ncbi:hypothetical protein B0H17DRAFT_68165 [Mycena rosella]|uniref:Uncharacterized protein n=1 Tax=Mycena rosella TaxID=1033263 RepID=A0AAD7GRM3_MYCRO|nr:hypothetical protein B0H17DRAFT_68165 [Mycena rosella]
MEVIRAEMADCTSIVDLDEEKSIEDLTGCVQEWVRERLAHATPPERSPLTFPPSRPVTVGVHVRWGDTAGVFSHGGFRGSMGISNIQRVLRDIRAEMGQHGVDLTVAMENADSDVLAQLNEPTYTFLDSGDALADLQALSNNDFLLLGESSYGVLAHLIAPPGLSIVELSGHHKYGNTTGFGRNIVFMNRYKPESLRIGEKQ